MQMERNGLYRTSDLYVAAWLLTKGFELQNIDRSNSRRCDFIFADRQDSSFTNSCGRAVGNLPILFLISGGPRGYSTHLRCE